jgi:Fur family peroxide stress response transcriptional regulator
VPVREDEVRRRVELLSRGIHEAGLKLTHQRLEILRTIAGDETHPDVETVYEAVRERVPTISLDTVYRTLATLTERGLITRVAFTAGPARYDANPARHHHFVCTRCGLVRDVEDEELDGIRPTREVTRHGRADAVTVQFRGVCAECQKKEAGGAADPAVTDEVGGRAGLISKEAGAAARHATEKGSGA